MTPEDALKTQIDRYRRMTGEHRLEVAFELRQLACDITR